MLDVENFQLAIIPVVLPWILNLVIKLFSCVLRSLTSEVQRVVGLDLCFMWCPCDILSVVGLDMCVLIVFPVSSVPYISITHNVKG